MTEQFKQINIPVAIVGPGSQLESEDGLVLDYMPMPRDMNVFHAPILMDESLSHYPVVATLLDRLLIALENTQNVRAVTHIDLSALNADELNFINRFLGEGEVAIKVSSESVADEIQETVLAGVWRVNSKSMNHIQAGIQVGFLPQQVVDNTFIGAKTSIPLPDVFPRGVMNAPSLLSELNSRSFAYRAGDEAAVMNLSLLPQSPEDMAFLTEQLGVGETVVLSRGYGTCRVTATQLNHVWWVQYFNSDDRIILNTLEVVDFPIVIQAALEDIEDSRVRLLEMMDAIA